MSVFVAMSFLPGLSEMPPTSGVVTVVSAVMRAAVSIMAAPADAIVARTPHVPVNADISR
jgi:hypothetical protein